MNQCKKNSSDWGEIELDSILSVFSLNCGRHVNGFNAETLSELCDVMPNLEQLGMSRNFS